MEGVMTDNKAKRGKADRAKVAAGEGYEVVYFVASMASPSSKRAI
jgi:hypothetical protein